MLRYDNKKERPYLNQIIALQTANSPEQISKEEAIEQGFITVRHTVDLLEKLGTTFPHTVALDGEKVAGYALTMLRDCREDIPVLIPMFELLDTLSWNNTLLSERRYVTMGQVCVDKAYRGKGVFKGLYHQMRTMLQPHFEIVVTEIAKQNTRSIRAHEKIGFVPLHEYTEEGVSWVVVLWDWSD